MSHDHSHDHGHDHASGRGHAHTPASFGAAFALGVSLNTALVIGQVAVGFAAHSMALLSDAVHNLGDILGLLAAWGAAGLARRPPSPRFTYGWGRTTILAALGNAVVLLIGTGALAVEAVRRLAEPGPIAGWPVAGVAALGILINSGTALLFARGRNGDLNIRGAFQHLAADAAVSAGVVVAALLIAATGATILDPLVSLLIGGVVVWGTWGLLRDAVTLAADGVPAGLDVAVVAARLSALPGVREVHDLHVWALSTTRSAVTAHLVLAEGVPGPTVVEAASQALRDAFGIDHATLQVETAEQAARCSPHAAA